jgi:predicted transcriptional regulator
MEQIGKDGTLARAYLMMKQSGDAYLPVHENGRIVGIISSTTIRAAVEARSRQENVAPLIVANYMQSPVREIESADGLDLPQLTRSLIERDTAHALVVTRDGKPQAILLKEDLLRICAGSSRR